MIITHRGYNTNAPENSLAAFDKALTLGANAIECDVRLTLDRKVIVCHDRHANVSNRRFLISQTKLYDLIDLYEKEGKKILAIDDLFDYIVETGALFFLEVKNASLLLAEKLAEKIAANNLWSKVYVIGFSFVIKNSLSLQSKYPKLRVIQLINFPLYSYIKVPSKSYGVFLGWLDSIPGSKLIFKIFMSPSRLAKLKDHYERSGFKVMGGVLNDVSEFEFFHKAGIVDIVTDNVPDAVRYFKSSSLPR